MPLSTKTICNLYGPTGLEQFIGKENADLVNDAMATEIGDSFALGTQTPVEIEDLEKARKLLLGIRHIKTRIALNEAADLMEKHNIDLIH